MIKPLLMLLHVVLSCLLPVGLSPAGLSNTYVLCQVPEDSDPIPGLNVTTSPRFCEEVRYQGGMYGKLFKQVFVNKTFHVYKIT